MSIPNNNHDTIKKSVSQLNDKQTINNKSKNKRPDSITKGCNNYTQKIYTNNFGCYIINILIELLSIT